MVAESAKEESISLKIEPLTYNINFMENYKYEMYESDNDESIDDMYDRGISEDDLRDDPSTRDIMNDPDSPYYNG